MKLENQKNVQNSVRKSCCFPLFLGFSAAVMLVFSGCSDSDSAREKTSDSSTASHASSAGTASPQPSESSESSKSPESTEIQEAQAQYVGNAVCIECHAALGERWRGSYHAQAMNFATSETVVGDFHDAKCTHFDDSARFFQRGKDFFMALDTPQKSYKIRYVIGFYPLQQYLVEFQDGRIQCLPYAWDAEGKKWYHLYASEPIPQGDLLHWLQPAQNWNMTCADCHTTGLKRDFRFDENAFHTTFVEMNVGCESCHGPGSIHTKIMQDAESAKISTSDTAKGFFTFRGADGPSATDACSTCHARRREIYPGFQPGSKFCDYYFPELLDSDAFYADGQIHEEDYEYTSFLQSKFYAAGGSCSDCHDRFIAKMPDLDVHKDGSVTESGEPKVLSTQISGVNRPATVKEICGRCHSLETYDAPTHHFHDASCSVEGTRCEDCHMPVTTYMGVDRRRDHAITIPRPRLTVDLQIPNACSRCHTQPGETPEWALETCKKWYGSASETVECPTHFAYALAAGRERKTGAETALIRVLRDEKTSAVVRASAASLLGDFNTIPSVQASLFEALKSPSELIRTTSVHALEGSFHTEAECLARLLPLLNDPVRSVRLEAVRQMTGLPIPSSFQNAYRNALKEYRTSLDNLPERPESHLNYGILYERTRNPKQAEAAYRRALTLSAAYFPARNNLGMLLYAQGRKAEAETEFRELVRQTPERADSWYSLGLLLSESPQTLPEAVSCFQKASELAPDRARIFYNLALSELQTQHPLEAEAALRRALELEPENEDFRNAWKYFQSLKPQETPK